MNEKENVDVENTQGEEMAVAKERQKASVEEASTTLGKFKDVDALVEAYEALQAEFTRRSQRLRSLEREVDNLKRLEGESGAEKLRKIAKARREEAKAFDAFVADVGAANCEKAEFSTKPTEGENAPEKEGRENAGASHTAAEDAFAQESQESLSSQTLFQRAYDDEEVRLRIVGEYLSSLGGGAAPLTGGRGVSPVAPPVKARTVGEAGNMALLYFRKPTL